MTTANSKKAEDLTITISVNKSPLETFEAIRNVSGWWIGKVEGIANKVGDEFTYSYKEFHRTTQKLVELIPGKRVVWKVTKSKINFVKDKDEWKGTDLVFEIIPDGKKTLVKFTHVGLTPAIECFENCSGGWEFYINKSLKNFIEKGVGIDPKF